MKFSAQITLLSVFVFMLSNCTDGGFYKTNVKYQLRNVDYDCIGYYRKGHLTKVLCLNNDSTKIIEHKYSSESDSNSVKIYFDTGELKEEGKFYRDFQVGVWKIYYRNGSLKEYRFYDLNDDTDSTTLSYRKQYDDNGDLVSCYLPLKFRKDSVPEILKVDSTYKLYVDLIYSEYDSVNCAGILDSAPFSSLEADTSIFYGKSLYYEFIPTKRGKHIITGTYFEMNANTEYEDERNIAERPFRFEYSAVK